MKKILGVFLGIMICLPVFAADESLFSQGNAKYQAGNFKAASQLYEEAVLSQPISAALYFNLGNAKLRLGHKAEALVYYRKAQMLAPRDKDIAWNIHVLQSLLTDRIEDSSINIFKRTLQQGIASVTLDEISLLLTGLIGFLLFLSLMHWTLPGVKFPIGFFRGLAVVGVIFCALFLNLKWQDLKEPRVVIMDKELFTKNGPSQQESNAFLLHEGAEGRVMDESKDWYYLTLANKNSGWVPKESCEVVS